MHVKITLILNVMFVRNISMYVCLNKLAFNRLLILDTEPKTFSTLWRTFIFSPVIVEKNRVIWSNSLFLIITDRKIFCWDKLNVYMMETYTDAANIGSVSWGFHWTLCTVPFIEIVFIHRPVAISQNRIVLSELPKSIYGKCMIK